MCVERDSTGYRVGRDQVGKKLWIKGDEARQQFVFIFVDEVGGGRGVMFAWLSNRSCMCLMTVILNMQ